MAKCYRRKTSRSSASISSTGLDPKVCTGVARAVANDEMNFRSDIDFQNLASCHPRNDLSLDDIQNKDPFKRTNIEEVYFKEELVRYLQIAKKEVFSFTSTAKSSNSNSSASTSSNSTHATELSNTETTAAQSKESLAMHTCQACFSLGRGRSKCSYCKQDFNDPKYLELIAKVTQSPVGQTFEKAKRPTSIKQGVGDFLKSKEHDKKPEIMETILSNCQSSEEKVKIIFLLMSRQLQVWKQVWGYLLDYLVGLRETICST